MQSRARIAMGLAALFVLAATACGLSSVGTGPAAAIASGDAGSSGGRGDAASSSSSSGAASSSSSSGGGTNDGAPPDDGGGDGASDASSDANEDAGAVSYDCDGTPVASCADCNGKPTGCIYCKLSNGAYTGVCLGGVDACYNNAPPGYDVCRCTGGVTQCPAYPDEVCNPFDNGYCQPCGDDFSDGHACRGGGTCDQSNAKCK